MENNRSWGNLIRVEHILPNGESVYSQYAHMQSIDASVKKDFPAVEGQKIGSVGSTGNVTSAHLHLEIKKQNNNGPGYVFYDPSNEMQNFFSPLLFIDDRHYLYTNTLSVNDWTIFD